MIKDLPIYKAYIKNDDDGMYCVSLVESPAVESNFLCFNSQKELLKFKIENEEERIITGVLMRCNFPIYRVDASGFEYYVLYDKETIEIMAEKWLADGLINNINIEHNSNNMVNGLFLKEVYIKDTKKGINPKGFEDISDFSLFATYKVINNEIWNEIKNGTYKGFSLEGFFELKLNNEEEDEKQLLEEILTMLKQLDNK